MRLKLHKHHNSIITLDACELPDFSVLIGRNGVGKSQILSAIHERSIGGAVRKLDTIERYDFASFSIRSSERAGYGESLFAESTAQKFFVGKGSESPAALAHEIYERTKERYGLAPGVPGWQEFENYIRPIKIELDIQLIGTVTAEIQAQEQQHIGKAIREYTKEILRRVILPLAPEQQRRNHSQQPRYRYNNDPALLVSMAMQLTGKLAHEIDRRDILRAAHYEGGTIANTISQAFTRYKAEQYSWAITESEFGKDDVRSLIEAYRQDNKPPWEMLREVLADMRHAAGEEGIFDFDFTDPEGDRLSHATHTQYAFETKMTNRTTGASYKVENLSSGETILMTLCMIWFNQSMGRRRPNLLLLDEVDAMLHPSMTGALVTCLKDLFVRNGTKVMMASHCPATVAVLDEGEVFRVSRDGDLVRIQPATRSDAVEELSDGIATLDTGLRIATADESLITIVTEGKNSLILSRWAELHFPGEVSVFDKLPDRTGAGQLQGYARILSKMDSSSLLLFVWDCDQLEKVKKLNREIAQDSRVVTHVLSHRNNDIAPKGIENKFERAILMPFSEKVTELPTEKVLRVNFSSRRKADFAVHIHEKGCKRDFEHFDDLHEAVSKLVEQERRRRRRD